MLVLDSPASSAHGARAEQLVPVSAAMLADSAPGREVLLEGRISSHNTKVYRDFVAYVREEYRDDTLDGTSNQHWVEAARDTPPLLVTLTDGEARIVNSDYALQSTAITVEEAKPTFTKGAVQSRGFVAGSPVLALGTVGADGTVHAEFIYAGTRAAYIDDMNRVATRSLPIGVAFLLVCVVCAGVGVWQLRRFWREVRAEQTAEAAT